MKQIFKIADSDVRIRIDRQFDYIYCCISFGDHYIYSRANAIFSDSRKLLKLLLKVTYNNSNVIIDSDLHWKRLMGIKQITS